MFKNGLNQCLNDILKNVKFHNFNVNRLVVSIFVHNKKKIINLIVKYMYVPLPVAGAAEVVPETWVDREISADIDKMECSPCNINCLCNISYH